MSATERRIREVKFSNAYYGMLKGYTVVAVMMEEDMEDPDGDLLWPTLVLRNDAGQSLEVRINRDPEGNGPGHIEFLQGQRPTEQEIENADPILWQSTSIGNGQVELNSVDVTTDECISVKASSLELGYIFLAPLDDE